LQPYCVNIPESFDPERRYPLIVYLHGSASDETNLTGMLPALPTEEVIALGPRGRGPSNCWTAENAQEDIAEAINAVRASYPIDDSRIILAGFSMGGYGVLRTHLQTPGKFSALAIFSGGPDIGPRWLGAGHPDFRDPANLAAFRDMPIFIFHGRQDRNVPFSATEDFVGKLRAAGADVEFVIDPDRGHERPGEEGIRSFRHWLNGH
jgi:predicted esterase